MFMLKILFGLILALGPLLGTLLTNKGKELVVDRIQGNGTELKWVGWGTSTGQTASSTTLAAAAPEARTVGTVSKVTVTTTNDTHQVVALITATSARAITEIGVFDALTTGNMFVYADFAVMNVATSDTITFTVKVTYA